MKNSLKIITATLFLYSSAQIICMDKMPRDATLYFKQCQIINASNKKKSAENIENACAINPAQTIKQIKKKLNKLEQKYNEKREDILLTLKNKYQISDNVWKTIILNTKELNDFEESNKHIGFADSIHDKNIPCHIIAVLKKNLQDLGFNPKRFNIQIEKEDSYSLSLPGYGLEIFTESDKDPRLITVNPGRIILKSLVSFKAQEAFCHVITSQLNYAARYYNIALSVLVRFYPEIEMDYILINELNTLSLLIYALKNKNHARILKTFYLNSSFKTFDADDYRELNKIHYFHATLAWLKKYTT